MTYTRHVCDVVCSPREPNTSRGALSKKGGKGEVCTIGSGPALGEGFCCVRRLLGGG